MDLPKVTIGGEEISLPAIMNFATLKRCWAAIQAFDEAVDDIARVSTALAFVAQLLVDTRPDLTLPALEQRLKIQRFNPDATYWQASETTAAGQRVRFYAKDTGADVTFGDPAAGRDERPALLLAIGQVLRASGLVAQGEAKPAETPPAETPAPGSPVPAGDALAA